MSASISGLEAASTPVGADDARFECGEPGETPSGQDHAIDEEAIGFIGRFVEGEDRDSQRCWKSALILHRARATVAEKAP